MNINETQSKIKVNTIDLPNRFNNSHSTTSITPLLILVKAEIPQTAEHLINLNILISCIEIFQIIPLLIKDFKLIIKFCL